MRKSSVNLSYIFKGYKFKGYTTVYPFSSNIIIFLQ